VESKSAWGSHRAFCANTADQIHLAERVDLGDAVLVKNVLSRLSHRDASKHGADVKTNALPRLVMDALRIAGDAAGNRRLTVTLTPFRPPSMSILRTDVANNLATSRNGFERGVENVASDEFLMWCPQADSNCRPCLRRAITSPGMVPIVGNSRVISMSFGHHGSPRNDWFSAKCSHSVATAELSVPPSRCRIELCAGQKGMRSGSVDQNLRSCAATKIHRSPHGRLGVVRSKLRLTAGTPARLTTRLRRWCFRRLGRVADLNRCCRE
jgi:hypothetical protein